MDIILGVGWHIKVINVADITDVDAACRDIGADKKASLAFFKLLQALGAHILGHVAMERHGIEAMLAQRPVQDIDIALAVAKNEGIGHILAPKQVAQGFPLVVMRHHDQSLFHGVGGLLRLFDAHFLRVHQEGIG